MSDFVELAELEDEPPTERDFRRANGAPMVRRVGDATRWDRYSRPSGWGKDLDDESNLTLWRIDRAMDGVASSPALRAKVAASLGQKRSKELRDEAILIGRSDEGADLGTALHAMSARIESEDGYVAVEPYAADLAAYLNVIDRAGLVSRFIECKLCSDVWRAAGTADRIYELQRQLIAPNGAVLEPGQLVIGDLKTGQRLDFGLPGFTVQLAIYCDSVFYDVNTDVRSPLPDGLRTDWALLVHLPAGQESCELHWCDLQVGREGAEIVQQVRAWRKRKDYAGSFVFPPSDEVAVLSSPIYDLEHGVLDPVEPSVVEFGVDDEVWVAGMTPWCQDRINQIGLYPEARAMLLRSWPDGVPPLREGGLSAVQLGQVLVVLDYIEAAFGLVFVAGDPREQWNLGLHQRDVGVVRGNVPPSSNQGAEHEQ